MKKELDLIRIQAGELLCTLSRHKGGISLYSLRDRKIKKNFLTQQRPLFTLTARALKSDDMITVSSDVGFKNCLAETVGADTVIVLSGNEKLCGVTVVLCAHTCGNRIEWTTNLISENDEYSLYSCDYPTISFDAKKDVWFLSPNGPGELYNGAEEIKYYENYPSYGASMQFMAFWNKNWKRGIYYGLHDPSPAYKKIYFEKKKEAKFFTFNMQMPLVDINSARNTQALYGKCVWEIFDGDWYDAALLYREFVMNYAVWKPEVDENGRKDSPDWMKQNTHWWIVRVGQDEQYVDDIFKADKDLGLKSAIHLYDWHQNPFDNDYPHYFPVKDAFTTGLPRLQKEGVRVMPYINGRLWDTRDKGTEDWQFTSVAKPNCTKRRNGEPIAETYSSKEADGSSVCLAVMCPSTACWQETITKVIGRLLNEVGVDAVYIDQIAAAQPQLCEDPTHSHRAGGGSWWMESYNNLLDHAMRLCPEGRALSTECTADPFMKHLQGYLTWLWVHNRQVPAFVVVYSGYVTMFGRNYRYMPDDDDEGQRIMAAQSLTFGEQMGWTSPESYFNMKNRGFYKRCVQARSELGSYMYNGKLLRTPEFTDDAAILRTTRCKEARNGIVEHSATFCEHWERKDGQKLLLLVNASEEAAEMTITANVADGKYALKGDANGTLTIENGTGKVKLPPLSVVYSIHTL